MPHRPLFHLFVFSAACIFAGASLRADAPSAASIQAPRPLADPGLLALTPGAGSPAAAQPDPNDATTLADAADAVPPTSNADPGAPPMLASTPDLPPGEPNVAAPRNGRLAVPDDAGNPSPVATATDSNRPPAPAGDTSPPVSSLPGRSDTGAPSTSMTINLIQLMVKRGLITKGDAEGLVKQAQQETAAAQAKQTAAAVLPEANPPDDTTAVTYVPEVVKNQIREEVTADVLKQQRADELAAAQPLPDMGPRFHVSGDLRVRYEDDMYPSGSAQGDFVNYNAINTGSGYDVNPNSTSFNLPEYNVSQDRNRFRLRARFGTDIDLHDGFTVGMRIGTGQDDSPVTENQTLGASNGAQGGNFSKYAIWLDRAFLRYEIGGEPDKDLSITVGRFENPFFHTSMLFADDLGFDGLSVQGRYKVADGVTPFVNAGAFPIFNTDLNFSSDQTDKFSSEDKYLIAAQVGTVWTINKDFSAKGAVGMYYYENVEGKVSDPMLASSNEAGNTDDSRPSFAQNGNTYIALRDYVNAPGATPEIEYYGLATPFHVVALTGQLDYSHFDPFHISITGELIDNVAFNRGDIINNGPAFDSGPQNNTNGLDPHSFSGGNLGGIVRVNLGKVALEKLWDWNVGVSYRYVESDATIDGFTDADFGGDLTGTNLEGYTIGGNLALSPHVWTGLRFMSADAIAGPTFHNDLVQFDINAQF
jgi:hypothetical protein